MLTWTAMREQRRYTTIGDILDKNGSRADGFDLLRLSLAMLILYSHSQWILKGDVDLNFVAGQTSYKSFETVAGIRLGMSAITPLAVPMFFALSGFLVGASADRTRHLGLFLWHRAVRIFPALMVEVVLSAFVLGAIFTKLPLRQYFQSEQLYAYMLNALGDVHFYLPGVFVDNALRGVININLWTLPAELYCYIFLGTMIASKIFWNLKLFTGVFIICTLAIVGYNFVFYMSLFNNENFHVFFIVYFFVCGVITYLLRRFIPANIYLFIASCALSLVFISVRRLALFSPFVIVYMTVIIGIWRFPTPRFLKKNDLSYGIYLYGFPVTQALYACTYKFHLERHIFAFLSIFITATFATFSWFLIEKRALKLKNKILLRDRDPKFSLSLRKSPTVLSGTN